MQKSITIFGNGNMAFALAKGLMKKYHIEIVGRDLEKLNLFKTKLNDEVETFLYSKDYNFHIDNKDIILAFKPNNLTNASQCFQGKARTVYSLLAGVSLETIKNHINSQYYSRVMPNIASKFKKSITAITGDSEIFSEAAEIFSVIGSTLWLSKEDDLNIATAISGSGPAYLALVAEAMTDAGVKMGLKRDDAEYLVLGLFDGFPKLLERFHNISQIKDETMSPKGTTAYGYATLEEYGVRNAFIKTIENAYNRALEISKKDKN